MKAKEYVNLLSVIAMISFAAIIGFLIGHSGEAHITDLNDYTIRDFTLNAEDSWSCYKLLSNSYLSYTADITCYVSYQNDENSTIQKQLICRDKSCMIINTWVKQK